MGVEKTKLYFLLIDIAIAFSVHVLAKIKIAIAKLNRLANSQQLSLSHSLERKTVNRRKCRCVPAQLTQYLILRLSQHFFAHQY